MHQEPSSRRLRPRRDPRYRSARSNKRFHEYDLLQWMHTCPSFWVKQVSAHKSNVGDHKSQCELLPPQLQSESQEQSVLAVEDPVQEVACREMVDASVQCCLDDLPEPIARLPAFQKLAEDKIMRQFWRDPQQSYSVDKHFTYFEEVETVCAWVGQLPDEEVSKLARLFLTSSWLGGRYIKGAGCYAGSRQTGASRSVSRHVTEACMLAKALPIFRCTLLFSIRDVLQKISSEQKAVATCDFIMRLIEAGALPGGLQSDMLTLVAQWPACILVILPSCHDEQESDEPLQRTQTVRASIPSLVSPHTDLSQGKLQPLPRTQSEPTASASCVQKSDLFRTQSEPTPGSKSCSQTSLRPHEPHVRFARALVTVIE